MRKIKLDNLKNRASWYRKIYLYLEGGENFPNSIKLSANDEYTKIFSDYINKGFKSFDIMNNDIFNNTFTNQEKALIKIAEETGGIKNSIKNLFEYLNNVNKQRQKILGASIYPIIVILLTISMFLGILILIIPRIKSIFNNNTTLPLTTKALFLLSDQIINYWYLYLSIIIVIIYLSVKYQKKIVKKIQNTLTYMPFISNIYNMHNLYSWFLLISVSLKNGNNLAISSELALNSVAQSMRQKIEIVNNLIQEGKTCRYALINLNHNLYKLIEDIVPIIDSGERTGNLTFSFKVAEEYLKDELQILHDRFEKMIEPLLIIVIGIFVSIICISIILPIYQLTQINF